MFAPPFYGCSGFKPLAGFGTKRLSALLCAPGCYSFMVDEIARSTSKFTKAELHQNNTARSTSLKQNQALLKSSW